MKNSFRACFYALSLLILVSCGEKAPESTAGTGDWSEYELTVLKGSDYVKAKKFDKAGQLLEEGYLLGDVKHGTWLKYQSSAAAAVATERRIETLTNYLNGQLEGVFIEFDRRGQMIKKVFYSNGQYDGPNVTYKFGRPLEYVPYTNGQIDGKVIKYYDNGKVREEIEYKDGVQHGYYNHYNEDQKLDLQYVYENGQKVSGGIVERDDDAEE